MDATDGANEIAIGHVCQGAEMCFVSARGGNLAFGADPLPCAFQVRLVALGIQDLNPPTLKRTPAHNALLAIVLILFPARRDNPLRHRHGVVHRRFAARALAREAEGGGEDAFPALTGLHCASREGFAFAHVLDVVEDGDGRVPGEDEVAVHAVDCEMGGNGELGCGEALGYYGAAVDAAGARGVPERARVGEDVLWLGKG